MVRKNYTPEQIINKLREAEIQINQSIEKFIDDSNSIILTLMNLTSYNSMHIMAVE